MRTSELGCVLSSTSARIIKRYCNRKDVIAKRKTYFVSSFFTHHWLLNKGADSIKVEAFVTVISFVHSQL